MLEKLSKYIKKPVVYQPSTNKFWDDEHISKGMLSEHLNPDSDLATRNIDFVKKSVQWLAKQYPSNKYNKLLDLGCGPGIYAEMFYKYGYDVTGVDISKRSIDYAKNHAIELDLDIKYINQDYLGINLQQKYDIITMIWCDYGVLPPEARNKLLENVYEALSPGGIFIFDVFSTKLSDKLKEGKDFEYFKEGGYWSPEPYLCLSKTCLYPGEICLRQFVIVTEQKINCYNLWEHYFQKDEITRELQNKQFNSIVCYSDISGEQYFSNSDTICIVANK